MFNITVINLKKLLKNIFIIFFLIIIILIFLKFANKYLKNFFNFINTKYEEIFNFEIAFLNYENISFEKGLEKILSSELVAINEIEVIESNEENVKQNKDDINEQIIENEIKKETNLIETNSDSAEVTNYNNLETKVVEEKNIKETYNAEYNGVKIKNESNYTLTQDILKPDIEYTNNKDIVIFHTHTCESYTPTQQNSYKSTGNYRTTDLNYTVSKVGDELATQLMKRKYNVIHDTTYHDYPAYTGSYSRSLITVNNILKSNSNLGIQTVIDLHRDAIGSNSDYGPAVMIGNEKVAQLMFVIGTNGGRFRAF